MRFRKKTLRELPSSDPGPSRLLESTSWEQIRNFAGPKSACQTLWHAFFSKNSETLSVRNSFGNARVHDWLFDCMLRACRSKIYFLYASLSVFRINFCYYIRPSEVSRVHLCKACHFHFNMWNVRFWSFKMRIFNNIAIRIDFYLGYCVLHSCFRIFMMYLQ